MLRIRPLPPTLEYTGEFGPELIVFASFCNFLSDHGLLKQHRIRTYAGMRCFYKGLDCAGIDEKNERRRYVYPGDRPSWLPIRNEHNFDSIDWPRPMSFLPLREMFAGESLFPLIEDGGRPLLIIHNKHNDEWGLGPVNHLPIGVLDRLFTLLAPKFKVIYIRHGNGAADAGFSDDCNAPMAFDDRALLQRHPDVSCFENLLAEHRRLGGTQDFNTFKSVLYSRCHYFISSQGGGAAYTALFSGSLLVVLHRMGAEHGWAYGNGYYRFAARVPPIMAVCHGEDDLLDSVGLFMQSRLADGRVQLEPTAARLLQRLAPRQQSLTQRCRRMALGCDSLLRYAAGRGARPFDATAARMWEHA